MKWIKIEKAKVKFNEDYLIMATTGKLHLCHLASSMQEPTGVTHHFDIGEGNHVTATPTHVCLVSTPDDQAVLRKKKEVPNE